jgi:hypothetical protein
MLGDRVPARFLAKINSFDPILCKESFLLSDNYRSTVRKRNVADVDSSLFEFFSLRDEDLGRFSGLTLFDAFLLIEEVNDLAPHVIVVRMFDYFHPAAGTG